MLSRQKYIQINHQYPSLVSSKFKFGIENLKRCKSPGSNQILAEPIQAGVVHYVLVSTNLFILFGIWKSCHSSGNNLVVPIYKEWWWKWLQLLCRDITVTNCIRNFKSTLLLRLIAYIDEIIGYRQHVCRCTISIADHIFWNDSGTVHQLFVDFKKACDSGETYCTTFSLLWLFLSLLCPLACYDPELSLEMGSVPRKVQYRKLGTYIHSLSGIRTHDPCVRVVQYISTLVLQAIGIGICYTHETSQAN